MTRAARKPRPDAGKPAPPLGEQEELSALLKEMVGALESCLACSGLSWEAEQEAELVVGKAKKYLGNY